MNILLLNPINRSYIVMPSLGLGYLASQARKYEHTVTILNCIKEKMNFQDFATFLEQDSYDLIGFQMYSYDVNAVRKHLEITKDISPKTITVAGGPHPSGDPHNILKYLHQLDFAFRGEAEIGFPRLLDMIGGNSKHVENLSGIPGLIWRRRDIINVNDPGYISNLDEIDFPSWDLLEPHKYPEACHGAFAKNFPTAPIIISRGCPFHCTFCAGKSITGPIIRIRSLDNVFKEMEHLNKNFGIREFLIEDENLTLYRKLVTTFCERIINGSLSGISWSCPSGVRIDTLDGEIINLMEQSGCYSIGLGIEFGTQKMLDLTKKQLRLKTIRNTVNLVRHSNIKTTGFFMMGVPGETLDDIKKTILFSLQLKLDRAQFNNFMPLPGSELGDRLRQEYRLENLNWDRLFVHDVSFEIPGITRARLKRLQRFAYLRFYLRPKTIIKLLREIRSFRHLRYLILRFRDALA